ALGAIVTPQIIIWMIPSEYRSLPVLATSTVGMLNSTFAQGPFEALTSLFAETPEPGLWRLPFMVIGGIGTPYEVGWLLSVRRGDLQTQPRPAGASLMSILGILLSLLMFDLFSRLALSNMHWLFGCMYAASTRFASLLVKGLVLLAAVVAAVSWLR